MFNVLVTCEISAEALAFLKSQPTLNINFSQDVQPTVDELKNVHGVITRSGTNFYDDLLGSANELKFIVTATSGFDHIDLKACKEREIKVSFCPEANAESAAQLTLSMILNALRNFPQLHQNVVKNHWRQNLKRGHELTDLQLGIVGFGRIGQRVTELAQAFQMNIVTHDPYISTDLILAKGVQPLGLIELFKTSDVVSFHVPLTSETKHMVNHRTLAHFNPDAYLINASRGAVFNETELAVRMREGMFSGAAMDVFEREPLPKESPLRELNNISFSPHVGAFTQQSFERASMEAAKKLWAYSQQNKWSDPLPPNTEWAKYLI